MTVYLIHFTRKLHHAQHYIGYTEDLDRRILEHQRDRFHLMGAVNAAKIPWLVARVWQDGDRAMERRLKSWNGSAQFCPICRAIAGKTSTAMLPDSTAAILSPTRGTPGINHVLPHAGDGALVEQIVR